MGIRKAKYRILAKGYRGRHKNCTRIMAKKVEKGLQKAYVGRKLKKRNFKSLWIQQVNAGARGQGPLASKLPGDVWSHAQRGKANLDNPGMRYSQLMHALKMRNIQIDRKILANLAGNEPFSFRSVMEVARTTAPTVRDPKLDSLAEQVPKVAKDVDRFI